MTEQKTHPFIDCLQDLAQKQERGVLAALRRGLGQPPGTAAEMFRYVEPFNPPQKTAWVYYLVATLFALHSQPGGTGNFGAHMRACDPKGENSDALERRFTALLAAHPDDLPDYLRQAVSFLKSKDIPVNWNRLFWDLQNWDEKREDPKDSIQKQWAAAFWGRFQTTEEPTK
jgi:CRISPR system Cascade subunit CasB